MPPTPTSKVVCSATRADGQPCRAYARTGRQVCTMHDPEHRAAMDAARAAGGRAGGIPAPAEPIKLKTLDEQLAALEETIDRVRAGKEPLGVARLVLYGISLARPIIQLGEMEERLKALEELNGQKA